jgi:translation initiation factor IF-2
VTAASREDFAAAAPVRHGSGAFDLQAAASAPASTSGIAITPTTASLARARRGGDKVSAAAPAAVFARPVVAHKIPPVAVPVRVVQSPDLRPRPAPGAARATSGGNQRPVFDDRPAAMPAMPAMQATPATPTTPGGRPAPITPAPPSADRPAVMPVAPSSSGEHRVAPVTHPAQPAAPRATPTAPKEIPEPHAHAEPPGKPAAKVEAR